MAAPNLHKLIERTQRRVEVLKLVNEVLKDDPEFLSELIAQIASNGSSRPRRGKKRGRKSSNFGRVCEYFHALDNEWRTIAELANDTGIPAASVRHMIYRAHKGDFESRKKKGHGSTMEFRLCPEHTREREVTHE